jgi:hypothetical protein
MPKTIVIPRRRVGVPRREGQRKIVPDGGAAGTGWQAGRSDQQIHCCRSLAGIGGRCWRLEQAACSVNLAGGVIRGGGST